MISKLILVVLGLLGLVFGGWAATLAFEDTTTQIATLGMMGMLGYLFHSTVIFTSLVLPVKIRKILTLLILVWHIPEALLIATVGMGIPPGEQATGIAIHTGFSLMALLSWYLAKEDAPAVAQAVHA